MPKATIVIVVALVVAAAARAAPDPVTTAPWREVTISVTDLDRTARFFTEVAGYAVRWRGAVPGDAIAAWGLPPTASGEALLLGHADHDAGLVRLIRFDDAGPRVPMRPGAHAWDTGCYFSVMVRAKNLRARYDEAIRLGWWTETPITYLEFGASKLNVVIFKGPDGVQVQAYERLSPPLPAAVGDFARMTRPFNVMQMADDRDAAYRFFTDVLGFATFYNGKPYTARQPTPMPLGIPVNLTTSSRYRAGIVYPVPGEFGRLEMIELMDLDGFDYSDRCRAPNLGILSVRYRVADATLARDTIDGRGGPIVRDVETLTLPPWGRVRQLTTASPDGALVQFVEPVD